MHRSLTPYEQGHRWREANGRLEHCWYKQGSAAYQQFKRGWKQADAEIAVAELASEVKKFKQSTDNTLEREGSNR